MDVLLEQMRQKGQVDVQPRKLTCNLSMSFGKGYFLPRHQFEGKFQGVEDDFASKRVWDGRNCSVPISFDDPGISWLPGRRLFGYSRCSVWICGFCPSEWHENQSAKCHWNEESSANWLRNFGWTSRWNRYKHTHVDWQYLHVYTHCDGILAVVMITNCYFYYQYCSFSCCIWCW